MRGAEMENKIGREFMRLTKYQNLETCPQKLGLPLPSLELPLEKESELFDLPSGKNLLLNEVNLLQLVEKRETLRKYLDKPITLEEFSFLLWGTQGVKSLTEKPHSKRTVPSAGSRHPFETYLLVNKSIKR
jgi:hypothetical protein